MARWENEEWITKEPDLDKIFCKDCIFRTEDANLTPAISLPGATSGVCKVYQTCKPAEVLFDNVKCPYYVGENDKEDAD